MNNLTWWRIFIRPKRKKRDPDAAKRARAAAFGEITEHTRAADWKRLGK